MLKRRVPKCPQCRAILVLQTVRLDNTRLPPALRYSTCNAKSVPLAALAPTSPLLALPVVMLCVSLALTHALRGAIS